MKKTRAFWKEGREMNKFHFEVELKQGLKVPQKWPRKQQLENACIHANYKSFDNFEVLTWQLNNWLIKPPNEKLFEVKMERGM